MWCVDVWGAVCGCVVRGVWVCWRGCVDVGVGVGGGVDVWVWVSVWVFFFPFYSF